MEASFIFSLSPFVLGDRLAGGKVGGGLCGVIAPHPSRERGRAGCHSHSTTTGPWGTSGGCGGNKGTAALVLPHQPCTLHVWGIERGAGDGRALRQGAQAGVIELPEQFPGPVGPFTGPMGLFLLLFHVTEGETEA